MDYKIPTEGGAPTAVEALRSKGDPALMDSPIGLARDIDRVPSFRSKRRRGKGEQ
jgi:hypothetical protein